jgi:hypothetical protein
MTRRAIDDPRQLAHAARIMRGALARKRAGFARGDEIMVESRPARVLRVDRSGILVSFHDTGAVILIDPATAVKP